MAARLNNRHQQMVRDKIQASQLINRLQDHVLNAIELKPTQVDAAKYLLNQALGSPRQAIEHTGEDGEGPIEIIVRSIKASID